MLLVVSFPCYGTFERLLHRRSGLTSVRRVLPVQRRDSISLPSLTLSPFKLHGMHKSLRQNSL